VIEILFCHGDKSDYCEYEIQMAVPFRGVSIFRFWNRGQPHQRRKAGLSGSGPYDDGHRTAAGQKGFVSCPGGWLFTFKKVKVTDQRCRGY